MTSPPTSPPAGQPVDRVDGRDKVTGAARYAADQQVPGVVYGYLVVSTVALATIRAMDTEQAHRSPGVLVVYTPFQPLTIIPANTPFGEAPAPLRDREVQHSGQIIGMVVAETFEQARAAANSVRVTYDERRPAVSVADGIPTAQLPPNVMGEPSVVNVLRPGVASIDAALTASEVVVRGTYTTPAQNHSAMEPHSAVAHWTGGSLTLYSANQGMNVIVPMVAGAMGVPESQVRVIAPFIGGSFGGKFDPYGHVTLAAAAARALNRPVKVVLTREQVFTATATRPATVQNIALGARADGTLTALKHDAWSESSVAGPGMEPSAHRTSRTWYATENLGISQRVVSLHLPATTIMRAPGEASGSFALESALDELAYRLGMDPVELRLKNDARTAPGRDNPWSSKHLDECYRVGVREFGWPGRPRAARAMRDGDWWVGTGMATGVYPAFRHDATARVRLHQDGTVDVEADTADLGTGMTTVLAVVGADALGLPVQRVRGRLGDSALPSSGYIGGSCGTATVGSAILAAAQLAQRQLLTLAAGNPQSPLHGVPNAELRYENGQLSGRGRTVTFGALLRATGTPEVAATGTAAPGAEAEQYEMDCFTANFC
ncbi:MAG TPA: xanthine dehydrogenase family protein molybdopterin-binding subunit, partial [Pseudonocardia sp.]|nr:xanthine dehydrogenase family protein molybdopterin-binding subunit [Pseudonocardia sp.]